jgi:hypothetical protein
MYFRSRKPVIILSCKRQIPNKNFIVTLLKIKSLYRNLRRFVTESTHIAYRIIPYIPFSITYVRVYKLSVLNFTTSSNDGLSLSLIYRCLKFYYLSKSMSEKYKKKLCKDKSSEDGSTADSETSCMSIKYVSKDTPNVILVQ